MYHKKTRRQTRSFEQFRGYPIAQSRSCSLNKRKWEGKISDDEREQLSWGELPGK